MTRDEQNDFIKSKFKDWQIEWHKLFDQDETLAGTEYETGAFPMAKDIDRDFRLIFGISAVAPETRQACFRLFPMGAEMCRRFEDFLSRKSEPITEEAARDIAKQISENVEKAKPTESVKWANIQVLNREAPGADEIFSKTGRVSYVFDRNGLEPIPDGELMSLAARLFLTEPFYMCAGNYYEPGDWIKGVLLNKGQDFIFERVYALWRGGWFFAIGEDVVVLSSMHA